MDEEFQAMCDYVEKVIAEIQNVDYGSPIAQALLDREAEIVLQAYYASQPDQITARV